MEIAIRPDEDERHIIALDGRDADAITPVEEEQTTAWTVRRFQRNPDSEEAVRYDSLGDAAAALSTDEMKSWMLDETEHVPDVSPPPRHYQVARTVVTTATGTVTAHSLAEAARLALLGKETEWELGYDADFYGDGRGRDVIVYDPDSGEETIARHIAETERMRLTSCARCGADLTALDEFTTNVKTPDGQDTHVHTDESRCGRRTVHRTIRVCGYLPSSREVEFTDYETGEVGYGVVTQKLAAVLNTSEKIGSVMNATGTVRPIAWSWPLKGHEEGLEIENLLTVNEDREKA